MTKDEIIKQFVEMIEESAQDSDMMLGSEPSNGYWHGAAESLATIIESHEYKELKGLLDVHDTDVINKSDGDKFLQGKIHELFMNGDLHIHKGRVVNKSVGHNLSPTEIKEGWVAHDGGKRPVDCDVIVKQKWHESHLDDNTGVRAGYLEWMRIRAYKVIEDKKPTSPKFSARELEGFRTLKKSTSHKLTEVRLNLEKKAKIVLEHPNGEWAAYSSREEMLKYGYYDGKIKDNAPKSHLYTETLQTLEEHVYKVFEGTQPEIYDLVSVMSDYLEARLK